MFSAGPGCLRSDSLRHRAVASTMGGAGIVSAGIGAIGASSSASGKAAGVRQGVAGTSAGTSSQRAGAAAVVLPGQSAQVGGRRGLRARAARGRRVAAVETTDMATIKEGLEKALPEVPEDPEEDPEDPEVEEGGDSWVTLNIARGMIVVAAILCGTNFAGVKVLQETLDASTFMTIRFVLAGAMLLPVIPQMRRFAKNGGDLRNLIGESTFQGLLLGGGYLTQAIALEDTAAGTVGFLCSLTTVVCPVVEQMVGIKVSKQAWAAAGVAVLGGAILELTGDTMPGMGDALALLQPVFFGIFFYLTEKTMSKYPKEALPICAVQVWSTLALSAGWAGWVHGGLPDLSLLASTITSDWQFDAALLWVGLVSTGFILILQTVALGKMSSSETAVVFSSEPIFAVLFASFLINEQIGANDVVGGALIIAACLLRVADLEKTNQFIEDKTGFSFISDK